jgi:RHS repeat-associated protein
VIWTSYGYDPLGQLTSVVDDHHNTTTATYDNLGRRTVIDSPDSGRTQTVFDLAGNTIRKITAKLAATNQAIAYDYDFNRLAAIRYPIFTASNVTYTYGAPDAPNNGAGRITRITDGAGTVSREYGPLGEVTRESRTSPAQGSHIQTFTTSYRYDTWNRILSMTYPDGESLSYRYNSGGQVDAATGVKGEFTYQYLKRLDYDKFEQRVLLDTGNGTRTRYTYDDADRRLTNLQANLSQGYVFQNLRYGYDNVGNVTSIQNDTVAPSGPEVGMQVGGPSTQTFSYDDLYRVTHAEGTYQPRTPRTDRYRLDMAYDSIHNITSKNQLHELVSNGNAIVDGKTTYNYGYTYGGSRPHAPTTLGIYTLQYDANGNQISRDQQPKPRRQMIWDEENRLACSHENVQSSTLPQTPASCDDAGGTPNNARYYYDDQGNRVVKDGAQFHMYPNQNYSTRGNQEFKHVYIGPTKLITKFVEPVHRYEDRQYYTHSDHLGSTGFITDDQGGLAEHLQYFPGGETWVSEHPSQPVPQQYTGKELDSETNLYYYGARYYDPRTQVWQTPDPALGSYLDGAPAGGVYHSPNLALYTYAQHNPIRLNDPTGKWVNIAIGAGIGLLVGVGVEGVRQAVTGEFNAARLAGAAGAGVVSGAIAGATMGASLVVEGAGAVAGGVAGGIVNRAITGEKQTTEAVVTDAVISGVTFGIVKGGGAAIRSVRGSAPTPPAARPVTPRAPCVNSFTPETRVLMADGSTKAIAEVKVGDLVMATDPRTKQRGPRKVTNLIVGDGTKNLVEITVQGKVITATDLHPFWVDDEGRWVAAKDLRPGDALRLPDGQRVRVGAVQYETKILRVHNLTIEGVHTYYVLAGAVAVLVHNCRGNSAPFQNKMGNLQGELDAADALGVRPVSPGQAGFDEAVNSGTVKWAVGQDGKLLVMPKTVAGEEISHTALTRGAPVLAAGEADIAGTGGRYFGLEISNHSGHYRPCNCSLDFAVQQFRDAGIDFAPSAIQYAAP